MLLSLKHKFIFLHIPKTGGSSARKVLEDFCIDIRPHLREGAKAMVAKRQSMGLSINPPHINLSGVAQILDLDLSEFIVVCVVRHPFDRLISYYKYLRYHNPNHRLHDLAKNCDIDTFVDQFISDDGHDTEPQFNYFVPTQDLLVKGHRILRYENIEHEFSQLTDFLGLPNLELPRINQSRTVKGLALSDTSKNHLASFEAETFQLMGYA